MFKKIHKSVLIIAIIFPLVINIILFISLHSLKSQYDKDVSKLEKKIKLLISENDRLTIALSKFEVNKQYLMSIGSTENQAEITLKAANLYNIDPKY